MFHVKQFINNLKIHEILFYVFLFFIPIQTRILYLSDRAYIDWYFNYHLAFFLYLSDLVLILCFLTWVLFDRPRFHVERLNILLLCFMGVLVLSMFRVKHLDFGLYQLFKWAEVVFLVVYIKYLLKKDKIFIKSLVVVYISSIFQAILGIWQFHVQHMAGLNLLGEFIAPLGTPGLATISIGAEKIIRAYGTFPHPNILGAFLVFGLFIGFYLVSRATSITQDHSRESGNPASGSRIKSGMVFLASCGTFLLTIGVFVTFSRLAWVTTAIGYLAWMGYMFHVKHWKGIKVLLLIGMVSCGTILFYGYDYLKGRALDQDPTALVDRGTFNHYGLQLISLKPTLGNGVGNYVPALQDLYTLEAWQYQPAHNIFIFIAAEAGIAGLLIFLWVLLEIFWKLKNIPGSSARFAVFSLLILFLAMGQLDHYFVTIQQGRLMFAVLLGIAAALPDQNYEELH